jgi:prepilin-type processing-associated H-X9-DG protein
MMVIDAVDSDTFNMSFSTIFKYEHFSSRHGGLANVAYLDGHVASLQEDLFIDKGNRNHSTESSELFWKGQ